MRSTNQFFHQISCFYGKPFYYSRKAVDLLLQEQVPMSDLYARTAELVHSSVGAVSRGISRAAPKLWEKGAGVFHLKDSPCPSPQDVLKEIVFHLSGRKLLY